jgi:hypothetical protein
MYSAGPAGDLADAGRSGVLRSKGFPSVAKAQTSFCGMDTGDEYPTYQP